MDQTASSGSEDGTLDIASHYGCKILHISRKEFSFGRSLNRACDAASGRFLVLISGHCIPTNKMWLQNLVKPISDGSIGYSYGRQIGGPETFWSESQIFEKYFPNKSSIPQDGFYVNNANSAIEYNLWRKYLFDEDLTGLEDMHLAKRLSMDGEKVGYVAEACVYHLHHENWSQVRRRFERESFALQRISPEVILRKRDLFRYFFRAVLNDATSSGLKCLRLPHFLNIILLIKFLIYFS